MSLNSSLPSLHLKDYYILGDEIIFFHHLVLNPVIRTQILMLLMPLLSS